MARARKILDPATGEEVTRREYARRHGMTYATVCRRVKMHKSLETPVRKKICFRNDRIETRDINVSLANYAKALGASVYSLQRHKRKYGDYLTYDRYKHMKRPEPQTYAMLNGERVALRRWAEENGESFSAVYHWAQRHGWDITDFNNRVKCKRRVRGIRLDGAKRNMV